MHLLLLRLLLLLPVGLYWQQLLGSSFGRNPLGSRLLGRNPLGTSCLGRKLFVRRGSCLVVAEDFRISTQVPIELSERMGIRGGVRGGVGAQAQATWDLWA